MKTLNARNTALALIGLAALTIYILACTSFSPDDTKVLYPAFDEASGRLGVAIYDRETKHSEPLFVLVDDLGSNRNEPPYIRAQWLGNGQRVLIYWTENNRLNLAVMPWNGGRSVRFYSLNDLKEDPNRFTMGLPVAADRVFLTGPSNEVIRLDLKTGTTTSRPLPQAKGEILLCPVPGDRAVLYLGQGTQNDRIGAMGRLDLDTLQPIPFTTFTNELEMMEGSFFAYNPQGRRLAFVERAQPEHVVVLDNGREVFRRPLEVADGEKLLFGNAVFTRDKLVAAFQRETQTNSLSCFGLMEIPLGNQPPRETLLIRDLKTRDMAAFFFQVGVSHDGKTAAVASTYLACAADNFKPQDCALFLVDLSHPKRTVTRIPVPLPKEVPKT